MPLIREKDLKRYYSIKEVAEQFGVAESTLRYWETVFPQLRPHTTNRNVRQYTAKDIEQLKIIHNLVKVRGFKIANARKMMSKNPSGVDKSTEVLDTLLSVREQLWTIKRQIERLV